MCGDILKLTNKPRNIHIYINLNEPPLFNDQIIKNFISDNT